MFAGGGIPPGGDGQGHARSPHSNPSPDKTRFKRKKKNPTPKWDSDGSDSESDVSPRLSDRDSDISDGSGEEEIYNHRTRHLNAADLLQLGSDDKAVRPTGLWGFSSESDENDEEDEDEDDEVDDAAAINQEDSGELVLSPRSNQGNDDTVVNDTPPHDTHPNNNNLLSSALSAVSLSGDVGVNNNNNGGAVAGGSALSVFSFAVGDVGVNNNDNSGAGAGAGAGGSALSVFSFAGDGVNNNDNSSAEVGGGVQLLQLEINGGGDVGDDGLDDMEDVAIQVPLQHPAPLPIVNQIRRPDSVEIHVGPSGNLANVLVARVVRFPDLIRQSSPGRPNGLGVKFFVSATSTSPERHIRLSDLPYTQHYESLLTATGVQIESLVVSWQPAGQHVEDTSSLLLPFTNLRTHPPHLRREISITNATGDKVILCVCGSVSMVNYICHKSTNSCATRKDPNDNNATPFREVDQTGGNGVLYTFRIENTSEEERITAEGLVILPSPQLWMPLSYFPKRRDTGVPQVRKSHITAAKATYENDKILAQVSYESLGNALPEGIVQSILCIAFPLLPDADILSIVQEN